MIPRTRVESHLEFEKQRASESRSESTDPRPRGMSIAQFKLIHFFIFTDSNVLRLYGKSLLDILQLLFYGLIAYTASAFLSFHVAA